MKCLLLVDLQNDFLPGGALAVPHGDEAIAVANRLQPAFELIVATQDWHPADHASFAVNHAGKEPGDVVTLDGLEQILWPVHCVQETPGAEFALGLDREQVAHIVRKGTNPRVDSYSGFFDNGRRHDTGLGDWLRARGVDAVYVLGLATDYCVKFTALDARRLGFATFLLADGCRGVNVKPGDVDRALDDMRQAGVEIIASGDVVSP